MKKYVITGATSFIGVNLIKELLKTKCVIYAIVRKNSDKVNLLPINDDLRIVFLNMDKYSNIAVKINDDCDVFYHLSWNGTRGKYRDDISIQQNNYRHSIDALNGAVKLNTKMFISAGSQAEYGICTSLTSEKTLENPVSEYGKAKLNFYHKAKLVCKKKGIRFKEPRFFSLYGRGDFKGTMIISILDKMISNQICDLTLCTQKWDFLHINDAVRALYLITHKECADGIYNFGSGDVRTLKDYISEMHRISNSKSILNYGKIPYPKTGVVSAWPDISKLQNQVSFNPHMSFEMGIKDILNSKL